MTKLHFAAALATVLLSSPVLAASPFDGTWRLDLSSTKQATHLRVLTVQAGAFTCVSCLPPFTVSADGAFHTIEDQPGFDETSVRIIDANTLKQVNRFKGRVVREETLKLGRDAQTAKLAFIDTINPGISPVSGEQTFTRTAAGPSGSHALSGSWRPQTVGKVSENGVTQTLKIDAGVLTLTNGEGLSFAAKLDGTPAPVHGDPVVDTVSVRRSGDRELIEVDSGHGKVVATFTTSVSADDAILTVSWRNQRSGTVTSTKWRKR